MNDRSGEIEVQLLFLHGPGERLGLCFGMSTLVQGQGELQLSARELGRAWAATKFPVLEVLGSHRGELESLGRPWSLQC